MGTIDGLCLLWRSAVWRSWLTEVTYFILQETNPPEIPRTKPFSLKQEIRVVIPAAQWNKLNV